MNKPKLSSPRLVVRITQKRWEKAQAAKSAACLISDAIRTDYPNLTAVSTDMATIRASDRAAGLRYTWLTPQSAQTLLLSFDQGWTQPRDQVFVLNGAVRVTRIKAGSKQAKADRQRRLADLDAREAAGEELSAADQRAQTKLRQVVNRPTAPGPVEDVVPDGDGVAVIGGTPPKVNPTKNPNLLAGRDRVYGARRAQPAKAFADAVEAEVERRLAAAGTLGGETAAASE
jgi:hypothetical protein